MLQNFTKILSFQGYGIGAIPLLGKYYEQALKRNPRDTALAAKMGKALQKTHQYGKAINYYKEAVKNEDNNNLRWDF